MEKADSARIAFEYRALEQRASEMQRQLDVFKQMLEEAQSASKTLSELPQAKGTILFSIGSGVLVRATPQISDKVLVEAGSGVVLEKTVQQAIAEQEEKATKLAQAMTAIESELAQLEAKAENLRRVASVSQSNKQS